MGLNHQFWFYALFSNVMITSPNVVITSSVTNHPCVTPSHSNTNLQALNHFSVSSFEGHHADGIYSPHQKSEGADEPSVHKKQGSFTSSAKEFSVSGFRDVINTLITIGVYNKWATSLSLVQFQKFPPAFTMFVPTDRSLSDLSMSQIIDLHPYHILPYQALDSELLQTLKLGSMIPTLLRHYYIVITNNTDTNLTVNYISVLPDLYVGAGVAVHGIKWKLDPNLYAGETDDAQIDHAPEQPEFEDEESNGNTNNVVVDSHGRFFRIMEIISERTTYFWMTEAKSRTLLLDLFAACHCWLLSVTKTTHNLTMSNNTW